MRTKSLFYGIRFFICAVLAVAIIFGASYGFNRALKQKSDTSPIVLPKNDGIMLVIDAGHGGEDAGAVADDGTLEKDLNLKIALLIKALCEINGTNAIMTREDDRLLYDHYDELDDYKGKKKIYDLKNRVRITNEHENAVYVGIHMNKFSSAKYSGTQVYYSKNNPSSELLARAIQNSTRTYLQNSNNRQVKRADSSIYVLNSLDCPAVLIECGFLSNEGELNLLKSSDYQARLALTIFSATISRLE